MIGSSPILANTLQFMLFASMSGLVSTSFSCRRPDSLDTAAKKLRPIEGGCSQCWQNITILGDSHDRCIVCCQLLNDNCLTASLSPGRAEAKTLLELGKDEFEAVVRSFCIGVLCIPMSECQYTQFCQIYLRRTVEFDRSKCMDGLVVSQLCFCLTCTILDVTS